MIEWYWKCALNSRHCLYFPYTEVKEEKNPQRVKHTEQICSETLHVVNKAERFIKIGTWNSLKLYCFCQFFFCVDFFKDFLHLVVVQIHTQNFPFIIYVYRIKSLSEVASHVKRSPFTFCMNKQTRDQKNEILCI